MNLGPLRRREGAPVVAPPRQVPHSIGVNGKPAAVLPPPRYYVPLSSCGFVGVREFPGEGVHGAHAALLYHLLKALPPHA